VLIHTRHHQTNNWFCLVAQLSKRTCTAAKLLKLKARALSFYIFPDTSTLVEVPGLIWSPGTRALSSLLLSILSWSNLMYPEGTGSHRKQTTKLITRFISLIIKPQNTWTIPTANLALAFLAFAYPSHHETLSSWWTPQIYRKESHISRCKTIVNCHVYDVYVLNFGAFSDV